MYRVHDLPPKDKIEAFNTALQEFNMKLPIDGAITPKHFSTIISKTKDTEHSTFISDIILRCQSQAVYSPENLGHFGLALKNYCHFTSPIRRYSDLLVHRALIDAYKLGNDGLKREQKKNLKKLRKIFPIQNEQHKKQNAKLWINIYLCLCKIRLDQYSMQSKRCKRFCNVYKVNRNRRRRYNVLKNIRGDYYIHDSKTIVLLDEKLKLDTEWVI